MLSRLQPGRRPDAGMTLVELLVAMTLLTIFMGVFAGSVTRLFDTTRQQQARSQDIDVSRNVVQVLDRQVRYARAVNLPVTTADGSQWVEWQVQRTGDPTGYGQTCYQWQLRTDGQLRWRSWVPLASTATPTDWAVVGDGVRPRAAQAFSVASSTASAAVARQQLTLDMVVVHTPARSTPLTTTFTALNTRTSSTPGTPVCQEVPRS